MGIEPTTPCLQSRTETFEFPLFIGHTLGKRPRSDCPVTTFLDPCFPLLLARQWHGEFFDSSTTAEFIEARTRSAFDEEASFGPLA